MKESGINHFIEKAGVSDLFKIFYAFESGGGSIYSNSPISPLFTGQIIGDTGTFWSSPGSGLFSGTYVLVNQSGLNEDSFTNLISFECLSTGKQLFLSTLRNGSGYEIGLNDAHKIYFRSQTNGINTYATSPINISSKNLISIGYANQSLDIGYYDFNSQLFVNSNFTQDFGQVRNDDIFILGSGYTGYIDYFLNFDLLLAASQLNQIASGFLYTPTGVTYETELVCSTFVTGYSNTPYFKSGIIAYSGYDISYDGVGDFTGAFPTSNAVPITGIIESGYQQIALTGSVCYTFTGQEMTLYGVNTGYSSSFGMDKIFINRLLQSGEIVKMESDLSFYSPFYNKLANSYGTGFLIDVNSGEINPYLNGLATTISGITFTSSYISSSEFSINDGLIYDLKSGNKNYGEQSLVSTFSGQQIFFNGINLISGLDFNVSGNLIRLIGNNTGISGSVFEYPVSLKFDTGNKQIFSGEKVPRGNRLVYVNGLRQKINKDYFEGSKFDLLIKTLYNEEGNIIISSKEQLYWE